jgi:hypothetical protein
MVHKHHAGRHRYKSRKASERGQDGGRTKGSAVREGKPSYRLSDILVHVHVTL